MDLPPGYTWADSPKGAPGSRFAVVLPLVLFVAFEGELLALIGPASFVRAAMFAPVHGSLEDTFPIYAIVAMVIAMLVMARYFRPTRRIGVGEAGVVTVAGSRVRYVAWKELRPAPLPPSAASPWAWFGNVDANGRPGRGFLASKEQTRLILSHRNFPARDFPGGYWTWLGLPDPYGIPLAS